MIVLIMCVNLVSVWIRFGNGSRSVCNGFAIGLGWTWYGLGGGLESVWGRFGVGLGSIGGRLGIALATICPITRYIDSQKAPRKRPRKETESEGNKQIVACMCVYEYLCTQPEKPSEDTQKAYKSSNFLQNKGHQNASARAGRSYSACVCRESAEWRPEGVPSRHRRGQSFQSTKPTVCKGANTHTSIMRYTRGPLTR